MWQFYYMMFESDEDFSGNIWQLETIPLTEEAEEKFSQVILDNKKRVEEFLRDNEDIPEDITYFITTTLYRCSVIIKLFSVP